VPPCGAARGAARDGDEVGTLGEVCLDDATDRPAYAGINTGLFKRRESVGSSSASAPT
jgi:hypothetical protein